MNDAMNGDTKIAVARLDERIKAIARDIENNARAQERALGLSAEELSRRLEILNNAYERADEVRRTYVSRELHDSCFAAVERRLALLEGRAWIVYVAAASSVAALVGVMVRFLFHV